jgi:hypothetical protein
MVKINGKNIDLDSLELDGIDFNDAPRFGGAVWVYGEFEDGTPLTETELVELTIAYPVPYDTILATHGL